MSPFLLELDTFARGESLHGKNEQGGEGQINGNSFHKRSSCGGIPSTIFVGGSHVNSGKRLRMIQFVGKWALNN